MGELDIAAKALLREEPAAFIRLALPGRKLRGIAPDETELQAFERRLDKLFRVEVAGEREPIWVHVEVEAVFSERVFPGEDWLAQIPKEFFMEFESPTLKKIEAIGRQRFVGTLLRHRLGKGKKVDRLLARLTLCPDETIEKIGLLVVDAKKKDLAAALDRLLPKDSSPRS